MKKLLLGVALTFAVSSIAAANDNSIVGAGRVQSFVREVVATGERQNEFGEKPVGYISYQPDGRMFFMLVGDNRAKPTGTPPTDEQEPTQFGPLRADSGTYVVEGDKATHKVDLSWNQSWSRGQKLSVSISQRTAFPPTTAINKNPRDGR